MSESMVYIRALCKSVGTCHPVADRGMLTCRAMARRSPAMAGSPAADRFPGNRSVGRQERGRSHRRGRAAELGQAGDAVAVLIKREEASLLDRGRRQRPARALRADGHHVLAGLELAQARAEHCEEPWPSS